MAFAAVPYATAHGQSLASDSSRSLALESRALLSTLALPGVNGAANDLWRLAQLRGASTDGFLLRSPSSMTAALGDSASRLAGRHVFWALVPPSIQLITNSAVPFSINDGAIWAGRGLNVAVAAGVRVEWNRLQVALVPQFLAETNRSLPYFDNLSSGLPYPLPANRSPWSTLWNIFPNGADMPFRFGDSRLLLFDPNESFASVRFGDIRVGVSTEHEWWGPGIENALLLSNNAAGVPRVFARSATPWRTRAGSFSFSTFLGQLRESGFYRTPGATDASGVFPPLGTTTRLLSAGAIVWQSPWDAGLSVGAGRSVFSERLYRGPLLYRWFDLFTDVGQPDDRPHSDSTTRLGRDQLLSLFGRWVLPNDGLELYVEWLRASLPVSLRDLLTSPSHSQGYTFGLQWLSPSGARGGAIRLQGEVTNLEQNTNYRYRPVGSIYTSRVVPQGYTQLGQPLGAAIGPGASSQSVAADYVHSRWSVGIVGERIRWNEDAHAQTPYPDFKGWCESDVSLIAGIRGHWISALGAMTGSFSAANRYNVFFQNFAACPLMSTDPGRVVDLRNININLSFEPFVRRF